MEINMWKKYSYFVLLTYLLVGFWLWPQVGVIALVCMVAPIVLAFKYGRKWCGSYCPRGSLWDNVFTKINDNKKIPNWAKNKYFRIFMVELIFTVFFYQMYFAGSAVDKIGMVFLQIIFITSIIGVVLGLFYNPRTWCSFCPMGSIAGWVSAIKRRKMDNECISCQKCVKICPMQIIYEPQKGYTIESKDCLQCDKCIEVCPKKAITCEDC